MDDDPPIHRAETAGEVERLLREGSDVETPGWMGATPLMTASGQGAGEVVRALLRAGANPNGRRPDGIGALHFCRTAEVAEILLQAGAMTTAREASGRMPLHFAAQFGRADVARVLLQAAAPVDAPAADGMSPLHWAAQEGHSEVARLLLEAGAAPSHPDHRGRTPLHRAAWRGQARLVELLLQYGAEPDLRSKSGETPFHEAEANGQQSVLAILKKAQSQSGRADVATTRTPAELGLGLSRVRLRPGSRHAVTVAEAAHLHLWKMDDAPAVRVGLQAPQAHFLSLAPDPGGQSLAVTTPEPFIQFRSWDDLSLLAQTPCPDQGGRGLTAIDLSADGRWIAVADSWEQVFLLERPSGKVAARCEGGEWTGCVRFDPSSRLLASACSFQGGAHVRVDRVESGRLIPLAELDRSDYETAADHFVDTLVHLAFSPSGASLALFETSRIYHAARPTGWRGNLAVYDAASWELRWSVSVDASLTGDGRDLAAAGFEAGFSTEVVFPTDETVACGATSGQVLFFHTRHGSLAHRVQVHPTAPVVSLDLDRVSGGVCAALGGEANTVIRVAPPGPERR